MVILLNGQTDELHCSCDDGGLFWLCGWIHTSAGAGSDADWGGGEVWRGRQEEGVEGWGPARLASTAAPLHAALPDSDAAVPGALPAPDL